MARKDDVTLLPDGAELDEGGSDEEFDLSNLQVNFSTQEAESEARSFEALPTGQYHVKITNCEVAKCGPASKNPGKPYYKVELTIQDGKYADRKLWTNVMLFDGALFTIAQIMKAMGRTPGRDKIPTISELIAYDFVVTAAKIADTYRIKEDGWTPEDGPKPMKTEVKGFKKYEDGVTVGGTAAAGAGSLLP